MDQTFPLEDVIAMSRPFVASSVDQGTDGGSFGRGGNRMSRSGGNNGGESGGGQGMPGFGEGNSGGFGGGQGMPSFGRGNSGGFGGGQGMPGFGSRGSGGRSGGMGQRGGSQRILPKDEQDRILFDTQSSTFFSYMLEKVGLEKMKLMIKQVEEGKESREFITQVDVLGSDFGQIESNWASWVQALSLPKS
jgi:hypothetical protein